MVSRDTVIQTKATAEGCLVSLFVACVLGDCDLCTKDTFEQCLVPGSCQVWAPIVILESVVEQLLLACSAPDLKICMAVPVLFCQGESAN